MAGVNYYWFPNKETFERKKEMLKRRISLLTIEDHGLNNFETIDKENGYQDEMMTPWDEFISDLKVHLGKRTKGWLFCWNFHNKKYYDSKRTLLEFIHRGRVFDEFGIEMSPNEFIEMALNWSKPNGLIYNEDYVKKHNVTIYSGPDDWDVIIDDELRVSRSTKFN